MKKLVPETAEALRELASTLRSLQPHIEGMGDLAGRLELLDEEWLQRMECRAAIEDVEMDILNDRYTGREPELGDLLVTVAAHFRSSGLLEMVAEGYDRQNRDAEDASWRDYDVVRAQLFRKFAKEMKSIEADERLREKQR